MTGNEPAMPCEIGGVDENGAYTGRQTSNCSGIAIGLTKREYLSTLALQGIVSNPHFSGACKTEETACVLAAKLAVQFADALIAKLNEKETA